jgi:hypothetical protein
LVLFPQNKKIPFSGNLTAALMAVIPFFAILLHYYNGLTFEEIENYKGHFAVILHMQVFFPHATCGK